MTIIRLEDGNLFVHSPIALSKTINDSIDSIGKPRFIIAPNTMHHLFLKQFYDQYSDAELYIVPGLREKRPDFSHAKDLLDELDYPWSKEIKQHHVKGIPKLEEVVFFHPFSKTLILTDLAFYITSERSLFTRLFFRLKKKSKFKKSLDYILTWNFKKKIISNGKLIKKKKKK